MPDTTPVDKAKCPRCGGRTIKSRMWDYNGITIKPASARLFASGSGVEAYVCKACGHVEIFVRSLDVFK
jgi:DNA-directed RNA polymerase subunit RPC12/RpoP